MGKDKDPKVDQASQNGIKRREVPLSSEEKRRRAILLPKIVDLKESQEFQKKLLNWEPDF